MKRIKNLKNSKWIVSQMLYDALVGLFIIKDSDRIGFSSGFAAGGLLGLITFIIWVFSFNW